ncbi:MAG: hypothetical protein QNK37_28930 [Acidobacteriota bacterium]|nr:hypothetical protein [Acidobacteriota bacterium]
MDVIIRLIIRIFEEIFSQDTERRKREHQLRMQQAQQRRERARQQGDEPRRGGILDELFRELQELEGPPPPPPSQRQQQQKTPPPPPRQRPREPRPETMEEHLKRLEAQSDHIAREVEQHLGVDLHDRKEVRKPFKLPGKNPLQQMVYGQVILGPCKARRKQKSFF